MLQKRYSQFERLHRGLKGVLPKHAPFPAKTFFNLKKLDPARLPREGRGVRGEGRRARGEGRRGARGEG